MECSTVHYVSYKRQIIAISALQTHSPLLIVELTHAKCDSCNNDLDYATRPVVLSLLPLILA